MWYFYPRPSYARWDGKKVRTYDLPDEISEYLLGDEVQFGLGSKTWVVETTVDGVVEYARAIGTVVDPPGPIRNAKDLYRAAHRMAEKKMFGVEFVGEVDYWEGILD